MADTELVERIKRKDLIPGEDLSHANLSKSDLSNSNLRGVKLIGARLEGTNFTQTDFSGAKFCDVKMDSKTQLSRADFSYADLRNLALGSKDLTNAIFVGADIRGAQFDNAILKEADLRNAAVDSFTNFQGADVSGTKIDRFTLECLGEKYGGLTRGQRMRMEISDSVAVLRSSYSGFWQWIHFAALVSFLSPYVWFVVWNSYQASANPEAAVDGIPLLRALGRFIYNGGLNWQVGWQIHWSFSLFFIAVAYNVLRFMFLLKTKKVELEQESSGLPSRFSLDTPGWGWGRWYRIGQRLFWLHLLVVVANTLYFMWQPIPLQ